MDQPPRPVGPSGSAYMADVRVRPSLRCLAVAHTHKQALIRHFVVTEGDVPIT